MSANDSRNPNCDNIMEGNPIEVYLFSVVIPDIVSSLGNFLLTYIIYHTVEIHHPQFAIIFQNHCFGNVINVVSIGLHIFNAIVRRIPCFTSVYTILNYNALQFHFISWLSVSIMRFHFISNQTNETISFSKVKLFSFAFVWTFFLSIKLCNNLVFQFCASYNVVRQVIYLTTILPVFCCILIYLPLKLKLKRNEAVEMSQVQKINEEENPPSQTTLEIEFKQVWFF